MQLALLASTWSKDRKSKVGAVVVDWRNVVVSIGWNGFPREIDDDVDQRHERPEKYYWTEHAERNAIYNAAAVGSSLSGCTMYATWTPCADCARAIIQADIRIVVCPRPKQSTTESISPWNESFLRSSLMLKEAGVAMIYLDELPEVAAGSDPYHSLNELADTFWNAAVEKGWRNPPPGYGEMLINLVGEVSELWESYRRDTLHKECDKYDQGCLLTQEEEEVADIIIRALDFAKERNIDLAKAVKRKHEFNQTREHRHGGKRA
jgi:dCMP deaminase